MVSVRHRCGEDLAVPMSPLHPCAVSGCPERLPRGVSRCPVHAAQQERQRRADTPGRLVPGVRGHLIDFYQTPLWRALRDQVLQEEPLCRICRRVTEHVDHIVPRTQGGSDTRDNLAGMCARCHSAKTAREMRRSA